MPEEVGQGSTSRATTERSGVTGRYVRAKTATGLRIRVRYGNSKTVTQRRHRDKSAIADVVDKYGHSASSTIITTTHRVGRVAPEAQNGRDAQADSSVEQYANLVLGALRTILGERLGAIAAADIDLESLGTPEDVAEWLASALPSSHPFDHIVGPFYDADGLARRSGLSPADVIELAKTNKLLGCPTAEGALVFPVSQFNPDGSSVAGLDQVLGTMAEGTSDRWQVALWLNTPSDQVHDRTPAQALRHGDTRGVQELAGETAARWRD
jgi:hypothetical protein